jgi:osmotically-inducible protein OsmY
LRYNSETAHLTDIAVAVRDGVVYLRGAVTTADDEAHVHRIVGGLDGVTRVVSDLWIKV